MFSKQKDYTTIQDTHTQLLITKKNKCYDSLLSQDQQNSKVSVA